MSSGLPAVGDIVSVGETGDIYDCPLDEGALYVVVQVLYDEFLVVERLDQSYYYGDNFWILDPHCCNLQIEFFAREPLSSQDLSKSA